MLIRKKISRRKNRTFSLLVGQVFVKKYFQTYIFPNLSFFTYRAFSKKYVFHLSNSIWTFKYEHYRPKVSRADLRGAVL